MKNKNKLFMFLILGLIIMPLFASAQSGEGILGGTENEIFKTVGNILSYKITIPVAALYAKGGVNSMSFSDWQIPLWLLFAGFAVIYAVLWLASGFVPLFKADENKKTRTIFVIALTLITMFTTPVMMWILKLTTLFSTLAYIAILILGGYTIWTLFRSGWASNRVTNSESTKSLANARQASAEAAQQDAETAERVKKMQYAIANGLNHQVASIKAVRGDLNTLLGRFQDWKKVGGYPVPPARVSNEAGKIMSKISTDLGSIVTFKSENDRLMSGFSKKDFAETGAGSLSSTSRPIFGSRKAEIQKDTDTQTNDLGRTISAMSQTLKGSINEPTLNNLLGWCESAINITYRMERDIVAEEQMINKVK